MVAFTVSEKEAESLFRQHGIAETVTDISYIESGEVGDVFTVETDTDSFILKTCPEKQHWMMQKEQAMCQLLEAETHVPTPHVYAASDNHLIIDRNYLILEHLPGTNLENIGESIPAHALKKLSHTLGQLLKEIHSITFDTFGYLTGTGAFDPTFDTGVGFATHIFEEVATLAAAQNYHSFATTIRDTAATYTPIFAECSTPVLCHLDYNEDNILVAEENGSWTVTGIIDPANMAGADPAYDLARTMLWSLEEGSIHREQFFAGYGLEPGTWRERLEIYTVLNMLETWKWKAESGQTAQAREWRAKAQQSLNQL